jgi:hypothetical protein
MYGGIPSLKPDPRARGRPPSTTAYRIFLGAEEYFGELLEVLDPIAAK